MVGIYVRVSTEEQALSGFSIRAQIDKLIDYCKLKDWTIFDIYKDEGISGKNIKDRKELNRLIDDIKNNKVNNVLVYKIDRLTRSTKDLIDLVELFNKYNCSFNSFTENIDTYSATGRMFIKIIGIFAEFERENIVERVRLGLERKVKEGYTRKYSVIRLHTNDDGTMEISKIEKVDENKDGTVTFETDRFSTYILTYEDTKKTTNPDTGDNMLVYFAAAVMSVIGLALTTLRITKKQK